jgi:hypothetical protein
VSALFLALCAASAPYALAASTAPNSSPNSSKTSNKKTPRKPVRKPPPPPSAEIPAVVAPSSVWRGCLESQGLPKLASSLEIEPARLNSLLEDVTALSSPGACVAYVAATGGDAGVASVIFRYTDSGGETRTLAIHKNPDGIVATPGVNDSRESTRRVLNLPAREFTASINPASPAIPPNIRWQLDILVPRMIAEHAAEGTPETGNLACESPAAQPDVAIDGYVVHVVVGHFAGEDEERLESVELMDQVSGKRVNGAWWLDRPDGPGVIIGMDGVAYERLLWESPVKYTRSARGVGASFTTWRRRMPAKKGSPKPTVVKTVNVPRFHKGVDMTAPKGTDVHAVGDATVSFAGRQIGFGNIVILDHGRGYQTYYAHLSKILKGVKTGAHVSRGDMIGLVGSTGHSTAPHLHFETRKDGRYLDPFDETHQLGFWLLTADEQERLAMQVLSAAPVVAEEDFARRY